MTPHTIDSRLEDVRWAVGAGLVGRATWWARLLARLAVQLHPELKEDQP